MKPALNVVYRNLDHSPTLDQQIDKGVGKLTRFSQHIITGRVVLDSPHQHKHKGKLYRASLELDVQGQMLSLAQNDESIHVALRDLFKTAERKVKEVEAKHRRLRH